MDLPSITLGTELHFYEDRIIIGRSTKKLSFRKLFVLDGGISLDIVKYHSLGEGIKRSTSGNKSFSHTFVYREDGS